MTIVFTDSVADRFPDLQVLTPQIVGVDIAHKSPELEEFKATVIDAIRSDHDLDTLKDESLVRTYRDFFWELDIDPTKTRPASEALVRRVLQEKPVPTINTLVDAYNLASIRSGVPIAAFDARSIDGELVMRFADEGEEFLGIGMDEPMALDGSELVITDTEKLVAIYPYRDADVTKITTETEDVLLMVCGAPDVDESVLEEAQSRVLEYVTRFCGGTAHPEE